MAYTLDTHAAIRNLEATGLPAEQAEAIVATISRDDDSQRANLATKADLADLKTDLVALKGDLGAAKTDLEARISATQAAGQAAIDALEIRLLKWGVGIALATAGLLFAALRLTG